MNANVGSRNVGPRSGFGSNSNSTSSSLSGSSSWSWMYIVLAILALMILIALYYETIGYFFHLGWERLGWSRDNGEHIKIDVPGLPTAWMDPLESDVEKALGDFTSGFSKGEKQVFNVSRNLYKFTEAEPLCRAFGAELATYDQVKNAYKAGADWCNYGWSKGQLALYPTQQSTYDKLQSGPEHDRMSCGVPGVNGGYFPNEEQRFGVNCYGPRPAESALDKRLQNENENVAVDREEARFRAELDSIPVTPWSSHQWSE